jgi:integrase/recombinase XerD
VSALGLHAEEYLAIRRSMGFKLERAGRLLNDFVAFTDRAGVSTVTVDGALTWARQSVDASPVWAAQRLSVVRGFARYLCALDPQAQVIPRDLLPTQPARRTPYLYSDSEIAALIAAARSLPHPLKAATFATLIGLLAVTGLRSGEAMHLDRSDLDTAQGLLTVRNTKFGKSRLVALHHTTMEALQAYGGLRDQLCPSPATASLFVSTTGARLCHEVLQPTFRELLQRCGIASTPSGAHPRVHGLRHSFAVTTLVQWYRDGVDVQARMPLLSTYLGHVDPGATYWYLTGVPDLFALAADRLQATFGAPS